MARLQSIWAAIKEKAEKNVIIIVGATLAIAVAFSCCGLGVVVMGIVTRLKPMAIAPTSSAPICDISVPQYRTKMAAISRQYGKALEEFATLNSILATNPAIVYDEDWRDRLVVTFVSITYLNDKVRSLCVPPGWEAVHRELVIAADCLDSMTDYYTRGIDENDPALLRLATEQIELASEAMGRAIDEAACITEKEPA